MKRVGSIIVHMYSRWMTASKLHKFTDRRRGVKKAIEILLAGQLLWHIFNVLAENLENWRKRITWKDGQSRNLGGWRASEIFHSVEDQEVQRPWGTVASDRRDRHLESLQLSRFRRVVCFHLVQLVTVTRTFLLLKRYDSPLNQHWWAGWLTDECHC